MTVAYDDLVGRVEQINSLDQTERLLEWDQKVVMPPDGDEARAQQLETISSLHHELLTAERTGELLEEIDPNDLDADQEAVVREVERQYERAVNVPDELVERQSRAAAEANSLWEEAKEKSDFSIFEPALEEIVEVQQEYAEAIDPDADPYEVLFQEFEPYMDLDIVEETFETLKDTLTPLIEEIQENGAEIETDAFTGEFDEDVQMELMQRILDELDFDRDRGRLDVSSHPFTSGTQFDTRITTRFSDESLFEPISSTIHEYGHALYNLGLSQEQYATPLGRDRGLIAQESQSRLWENHVGRSEEFWEYMLPVLQEVMPEQFDGTSPQELYESANQVFEDNMIRTEADELTYHMHVILRYEIGRDLVNGDLEVGEVPEVWNERMDEYLGVTPEDDAEGCLQDIHWSMGNIGYFPTYTMGTVLAAQVYNAAEEEIDDLGGKLRNGEFGPLQDWLRENIYRHGQRFETEELIEEATGEEFDPDHFVDYIESKYEDLYDL